jgi:erythromycin esterase
MNTPERGASRTISGIARDNKRRPLPEVLIRVGRWDNNAGETYYTLTRSDGQFSVHVPASDKYEVTVDDFRYVSDFHPAATGNVDVLAWNRADLQRELRDSEIRAMDAHVRSFSTPGASLSSLLDTGTRSVRVFALGESTHGTKEFSELRTELVKALVGLGGVRAIAIEAPYADTFAASDFLVSGKGDVRSAVKGLYGWLWTHESMATLLEWLRGYNASRDVSDRIDIIGIDPQYTGLEVEQLRKDVQFVSQATWTHATVRLAPIMSARSGGELARLHQGTLRAAQEEVNALKDFLARNRAALGREPRRFFRAVFNAEILSQALQLAVDKQKSATRDHMMARNALHLTSEDGESQRVIIWAHNAHVARGAVEGVVRMGAHLASELGPAYYAVAFSFRHGKFRVWSLRRGGLISYVAPLAPSYFWEEQLARAGTPPLYLDVRSARADLRLHELWTEPRPLRQYGGLEISENYPWPPVALDRLYDALVLIEESTPHAPLR